MVSQDTMEAMSELINRSFQDDGISLYSRLDVREDVMGCKVGLLVGVLRPEAAIPGAGRGGGQSGCPLLKSPGWGQ